MHVTALRRNMGAASTRAGPTCLDAPKISIKSFGRAPRACAGPWAPPTLGRRGVRCATSDAAERGLDSYPTLSSARCGITCVAADEVLSLRLAWLPSVGANESFGIFPSLPSQLNFRR